uniref:Uncharacterized protein n=1 Tax=Leersia perrieri TaxID=77586 RepID=A0A0D9VVE7_9ORYZ
MADSTARTVKDVNPHEFIKAYSAHLKRSGKIMGKSQVFAQSEASTKSKSTTMKK